MRGSLTMEVVFGLVMLVMLCTSGSVAARCSDVDRDALLAFKGQLIDSKGVLATWKIGTDCCTWQILRAAPYRNLPNEEAGESLFLDENKLSGRIPGCIGNLAELFTVQITDNQFSGPLPKELGKLKKLTSLRAGFNRITGPLPKEIGDLPQLFFVDLRNNRLPGQIPSNWGPADPITIEFDPINFSNNMLSGPIPKNLVNLKESAFRPRNPGLCGAPLSNPCK